MRDRTTITLDTNRADQLRELAARKRLKIADLITSWIIREFEELGETPSRPNIDVAILRKGDDVRFEVEFFSERMIMMTVPQARSLGTTFQRVVDRGARHEGGHIILDMDAAELGIEVGRRGAAVVLKIGDYRKTMPVGTAREIAAELLEAAEEYSPKAA